MTTSSRAQAPWSLQARGIFQRIRSLAPRSVGIMALSLALLLTLATYLLYVSLTYPMILLDPAPLAKALIEQGAAGALIGFLGLLLSGGLVVVLSIRLSADLDQPRVGRRILLMGGVAGLLWVVGALIGLLLVPLWGNAPAGLTQTLVVFVLVMTEIAAPLLLAWWTVVLSRQLKMNRVLAWIGAIGLLLGVTRSLVWCLNALLPLSSGFYGTANILSALSVVGASFWLLWLLHLGVRALTQNALGNSRAPQAVTASDNTAAMPRRRLLRGALGLSIGIAGASFVGARSWFMFGAEPELEGDDIPAEPSLIATGYYLIAWLFLKIHPQNSVAALVQQISPKDTTPPPPTEVSAQLGVEVTIEPLIANGVPAERISAPGASSDRWLLYIHGGGWAVPATNGHRAFVGRLSKALNATVLLPNYRLLPAHPFPSALNDCVAAYRWLRQQGVPASHIAIAGESAGGNLTLTTTLALREGGDKLPAVLVAISPQTDMAMTGETFRAKAWSDPQGNALAQNVFSIYTNHGATNPRNPLVSPLYADVRGFPPTMILAGTQEIFLSDATRMADKLKAAGVTTKIEVWPGQLHAFAAGPSVIPEARLATRHITTYVRKYLQG